MCSSDLESEHQKLLDLTAFNRYHPQRYPYLLLSSASNKNNSQFDILMACPQSVLTLNADKTLSFFEQRETNHSIDVNAGFFEQLEKWYQQEKQINVTNKSSLPFTGGWFVYLAYEMAQEIEHCLSLPDLPAAQPLAVAARCPAAIIIDKQNMQCLAVAETEYAYLLDDIEQDYKQMPESEVLKSNIQLESLVESEESLYLKQVKIIKQYILDRSEERRVGKECRL